MIIRTGLHHGGAGSVLVLTSKYMKEEYTVDMYHSHSATYFRLEHGSRPFPNANVSV